MKKDILCYLICILSIIVFIYVYIFVEQIPDKELQESRMDQMTEFDEFYYISNTEAVKEKYVGNQDISDIMFNILIIFTGTQSDLIYSKLPVDEFYIQNKDNIESRMFIKNEEDFKPIYDSFIKLDSIKKADIVIDTIQLLDDGLCFDLNVTNKNDIAIKYYVKIFNNETDGAKYIFKLKSEV